MIVIQSQHVRLTECVASDLVQLHLWRIQQDFLERCTPRGYVTFREFYQEIQNDFKTDRHEQLMINPCCSEFRVGALYAYGGSRKRKDILLSVYIDPKFQKSGYGVYAIAAYVKHLFNERNVEMVLFDVYDHNCSVVKILQRAGATRTSLVCRSTSGNESREVHRFAFTDGQVAQLSRFL